MSPCRCRCRAAGNGTDTSRWSDERVSLPSSARWPSTLKTRMAPRPTSTDSEKNRWTAAGGRATVVCGDGSVRRSTAWAEAAVAVPTIAAMASTATAAKRRSADMRSFRLAGGSDGSDSQAGGPLGRARRLPSTGTAFGNRPVPGWPGEPRGVAAAEGRRRRGGPASRSPSAPRPRRRPRPAGAPGRARTTVVATARAGETWAASRSLISTAANRPTWNRANAANRARSPRRRHPSSRGTPRMPAVAAAMAVPMMAVGVIATGQYRCPVAASTCARCPVLGYRTR